jgi:DNA recombination protein RmuC
MLEISLLIAGILIGGLCTGLVVSTRLNSRHNQEILQLQSEHYNRLNEAEGRVRASEAVIGELRSQIQQKEAENGQLRVALDEEGKKAIEAATRLEESQRQLEASFKGIEEQKRLLEAMREELSDLFKVHASEALKGNNEAFLSLAREHLGKVIAETKGSLGEHKQAIDGAIRPLQDMLKRYEEQLQKIENERSERFGALSQHIRALSTMQEQLQKETSNLVNVLRRPQVSGSWGELGLRRVVELAGMTGHCHFFEQASVSTDTGRLRPDMLVRLPNNRIIVVDVKAPVDAYLKAVSMVSEEERNRAMAGYIQQVREHIKALSSKAYWDQFEQSPEIVVMYMPGESFFSAALENDPKLIEDAASKKVILSTPTTLIALLKAIAYGWQQDSLAKSAREISSLGKELYERFSVVVEHLSDLGNALKKAVEAYNKGVSSMQTRLIPSFKRFKDLGVSTQKEIKDLPEINNSITNTGYLLPGLDDPK